MKQYEAVILAMKQNGGYATLGQLYQSVPKIADCQWGTKTPFASIRRIVQTYGAFFKIRPGLWALSAEKERVLQLFATQSSVSDEKNYSHYFFQGLIVEIGNLKGFQTFVPAQDKNKFFAQKKLGELATLTRLYEFTYPEVLRSALTIDVTWVNARKYPSAFFEIEHSTNMYRSFLKFLEFQDFRANFYIVADSQRQKEFESKIASSTYEPIKAFVKFRDYDAMTELHAKVSASVLAEQNVL